jgi:hypothetical protein
MDGCTINKSTYKLNQESLPPAIMLVMLFASPTPPSPTHPTTIVLAPHTIFLPTRSWAEWRSRCGRQSLVERYPEKLYLEVITDLKANLRWVAKQIKANPHLKANVFMSNESYCMTPVKMVSESDSPCTATEQCTPGWRNWSTDWGTTWQGQSELYPGTPAHSWSCVPPARGQTDLLSKSVNLRKSPGSQFSLT